MKAKIKLFTSQTCPNCPAAKNEITELKKLRNDFDLEIFETTTSQGSKEARKFDIMSVPTYIIQGSEYDKNIGLVGSQGLKVLNKYLDLALGIKQEKTSLWKKLFR